jgi:pyridinium-3,5-bisthiocarboxylic acid mononucleotide nickel chelatase
VNIAHFDCSYGISCGRILGAFVNAGFDKEIVSSLPERFNLKNVNIEINHITINDIPATEIKIKDSTEFVNRNLTGIFGIIDAADTSLQVKNKAKEIFQHIAEVKSLLLKTTIDKIDLRELASSGTIIEIVGTVEALAGFGIEKVYTNKIRVGSGAGDTPEGKYPVPKPLTANLLKGFIIQNCQAVGELVTPAGAAVLYAYAKNNLEPAPGFKLLAAGYGAGEFYDGGSRGVFHIMIGEVAESKMNHHNMLIEFNVDDMNPQMVPYLIEKTMEAGASDAFVTQVIMKKGRPGYLFSIVCSSSKEKEILRVIFRESTTIGVRKIKSSGAKLKHRKFEAETPFGKIAVKEITNESGNKRIVPEFEECKKIAERESQPLKMINEQLLLELNYKENVKN